MFDSHSVGRPCEHGEIVSSENGSLTRRELDGVTMVIKLDCDAGVRDLYVWLLAGIGVRVLVVGLRVPLDRRGCGTGRGQL